MTDWLTVVGEIPNLCASDDILTPTYRPVAKQAARGDRLAVLAGCPYRLHWQPKKIRDPFSDFVSVQTRGFQLIPFIERLVCGVVE